MSNAKKGILAGAVLILAFVLVGVVPALVGGETPSTIMAPGAPGVDYFTPETL